MPGYSSFGAGSNANPGLQGAVVWGQQGGRANKKDLANIGNKDYFTKKYGSDVFTTDIYDQIREQARAAEKKQVNDLKRAQEEQYRKFNAGDYKAQSFGLIANQEGTRLAGELKQNANSYNQRGLLYSGLRQGADARSRVQSASTLAQAKQGINQQADELKNQLRTGAIKTGFDVQANMQLQANMAYQQALANMAAKKSSTGTIFGVVGAGVGGYLGGPMGAMGGAAAGQSFGEAVG